MPQPDRLFAVVPAAGRSVRMGRPKLLLPLGETTVLRRLLDALDRPEIVDRVVVVRPGDDALADEARQAGATVIQPATPPADMRESVQRALESISARYAPRASEGWLLVPADHPVLDGPLIERLIAEWRTVSETILVPTHAGRRGHPTFFRWSLAAEVASIPPDRGLNWLVEQQAERLVTHEVPTAAVRTDLDTPADYEALRQQWAKPSSDARPSLDGLPRFPET